MKQSSPLTYRQRLARKQKQNDIVFCTLCGLAIMGIVAMIIFNGWARDRFKEMDADIAQAVVLAHQDDTRPDKRFIYDFCGQYGVTVRLADK